MVRDGLVIEQPVGVGRGDPAMALVRGDDHDSLAAGRKVEGPVHCVRRGYEMPPNAKEAAPCAGT